MAVAQSTYNTLPAVAVAGMIADTEVTNVISRTLEDATSVAPGKALFRGTGDHGCTATPSANLYGFAVVNPGQPAASSNPDNYKQYDTVSIITAGAVWVTAGEAITAGAQAYVTSGGAIVDTATSNTILAGWFFDMAAANGALVRIAKR